MILNMTNCYISYYIFGISILKSLKWVHRCLQYYNTKEPGRNMCTVNHIGIHTSTFTKFTCDLQINAKHLYIITQPLCRACFHDKGSDLVILLSICCTLIPICWTIIYNATVGSKTSARKADWNLRTHRKGRRNNVGKFTESLVHSTEQYIRSQSKIPAV